MHRSLVALLVLAGIGVGYLAGVLNAEGPAAGLEGAREAEDLRAQVARLRMALGERGASRGPDGPILGGGGTAPDGSGSTGGAGPAFEATESFDVRKHADADEAFRKLLAYAATMLARGEEGHMALLETLNRSFFDKPGEEAARRLIGSEAEAARFLYPLLRFAMNHDAQIADMTETVFRTAAENPQRLEALDDDVLELFTEAVAYMLPGVVGPERLERFAGYAEAVLATDPAKQPRAVVRVRRDVQRALDSWAPPVSSQAAFDLLQGGEVSPERAASLLRRLEPDQIARLDIDALVGPMMERDPYRVLGLVSSLKPDGANRDRLDQRVISGVVRGTFPAAFVAAYVQYTQRGTWAGARGLIEGGLQQATEPAHADAFAGAALQLRDGPDAAWVAWALDRHRFGDAMRKRLRERAR